MNEEYILKIVLEDGEFLVSVNGVTKKVGTLKKAFDLGKQGAEGLNDALDDTKKKNEQLIKDTGLAGATLTEFGRTISDLPFGIQGVANNLSQLSTLFITLVAKSKDGGSSMVGFRNAIDRLLEQLKGPLGFILAFQTVISLLDFFSRRTKKAEEDLSSFNDTLSKNILISEQFKALLDDANVSLIERERILKAASNRHSQLQKILSDENLTQEERNRRAERFLELEDARLKLTKESQREEKQLFAARDNLTQKQAELNELKAKENEFDEGFVVTAETRTAAINEVEKAEKELNLVTQAFITLQGQLANVSVLQTELLKSNTKAKNDNVKVTITQESLFDDFVKSQLAGIELTREKEISALKQRALSFEKFQEGKDLIIRLSKNAELKVLQDLLDSNRVFGIERIKIEQEIARITGELLDNTQDKIKKTTKESKTKFQKDLEEISALLGQIENIANMFTDAELSREEAKTVALNNELRERLRNENLSKEERIRINKEIENNELKLQKRRDEIAERNFKLQKAFAIAQAAINTALAVSDVLAREKTGLIGKTAAAIIIGALGAAQIAAIASTKFVPTATSVPGGVGAVGAGRSARGVQDPSFNIVGTGQQFQLAQVIAQRTGEPIRAFVVSGDVRTGLALDRNIINSSKIN